MWYVKRFGIIVSLAVFIVQGCIFDKDDSESSDFGTFELVLSNTSFRTYPGGGGISMIELIPSEDFDGSVRLSLNAPGESNAYLNKRILTAENPITELVIHPELKLDFAEYDIELRYSHGGKTEMIVIPVRAEWWWVFPSAYSAAQKFLNPSLPSFCQKSKKMH